MAEVKQNFIKSRMNQDLEARLVSQGEYREGRNINVSKSEGDDVGELENIIGNKLLSDFGLAEDYACIGHVSDGSNDTVYLFVTNYRDNSSDYLSNPTSHSSAPSYIIEYNIASDTYILLVGGAFLNFSKNSIITGINIIENLLFWTDNRNQPRKINITSARSQPYTSGNPYYFSEDQISVAKYYPYNSILLLDRTYNAEYWNSSMKDVTSKYLPPHMAAKVSSVPGTPTFTTFEIEGEHTLSTNLASGVSIVYDAAALNGDLITSRSLSGKYEDVLTTGAVNVAPCNTEITIAPSAVITTGDLEIGDVVYFHRRNPFYRRDWPGDPDFLSEKFVRFSYRFEFDDGEKSLMAPFTQIAFVPKQDGYFLGTNAEDDNPNCGQEAETYGSSIVDFMENKVNDINLFIPKATVKDAPIAWDDLENVLKVSKIEILMRESDSLAVRVVDVLNVNELNLTANELVYNYQSQKPWKTLPESDTTRVWDKVPVRAQAQESSGNRIIYGNYLNKHTSPDYLNYTLQIADKPPLPELTSSFGWGNDAFYVRKEYQNHTLKQNRSYQVGIVLSDRYGRQSDVILSKPVEEVSFGGLKNSTIYHPYRNAEAPIITDSSAPVNPSDTWPGDQLNLNFTNIIPSVSPKPGYPGLYSLGDGEVIGFTNFNGGLPSCGWPPGIVDCVVYLIGRSNPDDPAQIQFSTNGAGCIDETSLVIVNPGSGYFNGEEVCLGICSGCAAPPCWPIGAPEVCLRVVTAPRNALGWYSYKVVVKQTEQEYYNVYLPGILSGYPDPSYVNDWEPGLTTPTDVSLPYPSGEGNRTSHIVLINDNINKVPRDLNQVGPQQKEFRSSVRLFGRVENVKIPVPGSARLAHLNRQYQPDILGDTVNVIGTMTDLKLGDLTTDPVAPSLTQNSADYELYNFYDPISDPLIAGLSTQKKIGWEAESMDPFLAVYETEPVESNLDIYWESSSSGLISELNELILEGDEDLAVGISDPSLNFPEDTPPLSYIGIPFQAVNQSNVGLGASGSTINLISIEDDNGAPVVGKITLETVGIGIYQFRLTNVGWFADWADPGKNLLQINLEIVSLNGTTLPIVIPCPIDNVIPNERMYYDRDRLKEDTWNLNSLITTIGAPAKVPIPKIQGAISQCDSASQAEPAANAGAPQAPAFPSMDGSLNSQGIIRDSVQIESAGPKSKPQYFPNSGMGMQFPGIWGFDYLTRDPSIFSQTGEGTPASSLILGQDLWKIDPYAKGKGWKCTGSSDPNAPCFRGFDTACNHTNWDGWFYAANGSFGSILGQNPAGPDRWVDIHWEVVRHYQLSSWAFMKGAFPSEVVFGDNSYGYNEMTNSGWLYTNQAQGVCSRWRRLGLPKGPIYWENNNLLQESSTTNLLGNCEKFVGERYNIGSPYSGGKRHYWPDLEWLRIYGFLEGVQGDTGLMQGPPNPSAGDAENVPILINEDMNGWTNCDQDGRTALVPPTSYGPQISAYPTNNQGDPLSNGSWTSTWYGGGGEVHRPGSGKNYPYSGIFRMIPGPQSAPFSKARLVADSAPPLYTSPGATTPVTLAGRYVVTVRATDMSSSTFGQNGAFVEWDVPVVILPGLPWHWDDANYYWLNCECPGVVTGCC